MQPENNPPVAPAAANPAVFKNSRLVAMVSILIELGFTGWVSADPGAPGPSAFLTNPTTDLKTSKHVFCSMAVADLGVPGQMTASLH